MARNAFCGPVLYFFPEMNFQSAPQNIFHFIAEVSQINKYLSQARQNNLADVAAKDGSQETMVNLAALITSLVLLPRITHSLT